MIFVDFGYLTLVSVLVVAANRFKKNYAALCWNADVARFARQDDGANVLVLPADFLSEDKVFEIIKAWLLAQFKGNEYQARLKIIDE